MVQKRKYIVGNWKMHGLNSDIETLVAIDAYCAGQADSNVAICPPATLLVTAANAVSNIGIGAQDCHEATKGAHTGCLSAGMLKQVGAGFSIVGHSERRADQFETDRDVAAKARALHDAGMGAIICVGETLEQRDSGKAIDIVCSMLVKSLPEGAHADWLTIAYEPVWAVGTGRIPSVQDLTLMHDALREALIQQLGDTGSKMTILYGGSVKGDNAAEILAIENVGGALVGGASLKAESFIPIIEAS